ncbi:MAG: 23S rRNA (guanosine(2251)-2'-O)-methyltransferase RlmB [Pseudomonadota bacterium]
MKDHAFGIHAVAEILKQNPTAIERLFLQAGRLDHRAESILKRAESSGITVQRVARSELDQLVDGRHQGVIATLAGTRVQDQDLRWSEQQLLHAVEHNDQALILVLDGVTDPHNLGACLRSADAAGATAVVIPKDKSADITPTVRKVACGACATVPLVRVTNLARSLVALKESGIWFYGAAGEAETSLYETRARGPIALVMGAEGSGMRRLTREHCDFLIAIPMAGAVESLNVSVATGICLFELQRQRSNR